MINVLSHDQHRGYEDARCDDDQDRRHLTQSHTADNDGVSGSCDWNVPPCYCSQQSVPKEIVQAAKWFKCFSQMADSPSTFDKVTLWGGAENVYVITYISNIIVFINGFLVCEIYHTAIECKPDNCFIWN